MAFVFCYHCTCSKEKAFETTKETTMHTPNTITIDYHPSRKNVYIVESGDKRFVAHCQAFRVNALTEKMADLIRSTDDDDGLVQIINRTSIKFSVCDK
jgi:hypothetical protein